jgi:hypothetical protein
MEKVDEILGRCTALPLGDVTRDRNCGPPQLVGQAKHLILRKRLGPAVDRDDDIHRLLPSNQIAEMFDYHRSIPFVLMSG